TPTIFLSIESDELRHMANGYQTIVSVVDDPDNMEYLQTDIDNAFWINHKFITPFVGAAFDYFAKNKTTPWAKTWDKWIYEHWAEDGYDDPANHALGVDLFINGKIPVYICRVCQMPTIMPTFYDGLTNVRILEYGGRKHALCSEWCERMYLKEPERYTGQ